MGAALPPLWNCRVLLVFAAYPAWAVDYLTRDGACVFAFFEDLNAVYEYVLHADGVLVGIGEGCVVADCIRIEDCDICVVADLEEAAIFYAKV